MPPSSVAARSLALAVIGVGAASFAAQGQNVTAFNPYSGAGLPGGPLPQFVSPPAAPTVGAVGPGPVVGPAFNPWSSRTPALASRPAVPPQTSGPAARAKTAASLPPPPSGPIKSRVVAVPELTTSRSKPRDIEKASAAYVKPALKPASTPSAPPVAAPALASLAQPPTPAAPIPTAPPTPAAPLAAPPQPVAAAPAPPSVPSAPAPTIAPKAPGLTAPTPVPPPQPPAASQRQMAAIAPAPSSVTPARGSAAVTLVFTARSAELSDVSKLELDRLAKNITERTLRQVELRTIADNGDPDSRKISLARALIVRNYLIDKGVRSRIEIASIVGDGGERVEIMVPGT